MDAGGNEVEGAKMGRKRKRKRKVAGFDSNLVRPSAKETDRPDNERNHCETVSLSEEGAGDLAEPSKKKHRSRKAGTTGRYGSPPASSEQLLTVARGNETVCSKVRKGKKKKLRTPSDVLTEPGSDGEVRKHALKLVKDKKLSKHRRKSSERNARGRV